VNCFVHIFPHLQFFNCLFECVINMCPHLRASFIFLSPPGCPWSCLFRWRWIHHCANISSGPGNRKENQVCFLWHYFWSSFLCFKFSPCSLNPPREPFFLSVSSSSVISLLLLSPFTPLLSSDVLSFPQLQEVDGGSPRPIGQPHLSCLKQRIQPTLASLALQQTATLMMLL
jgi:hypothetical protein